MLPGEDQARAEHQGLRYRMLTGKWGNDLEKGLEKHFSADRRSAQGIVELSRNPFRSLATQVGGALYAQPPAVRGPMGAEGLVQAVEQAGYWQIQQRQSTDLVGIREAFTRIDWSERGGLLYRPVPAEFLCIRAVPEAPDVPAFVEELQQRAHPDTGQMCWCWETLDITDLDHPVHVVMSADRKEDWTAECIPTSGSGDKFQYRDTANGGRPFIPGVLYHAERTGKVWDAYYGLEAVLGTITVGVLLTFWVHGVKDGSFATVLLAGGRISGLEVRSPSGTRTQVISAEPGSIIEIAPIEGYEGQVQVVQLQPGFSPDTLMAAISGFEGGLAEYAGVSAADLVRTGADPRSGVSLSVSREGLRRAQARFEPQLRRGDLDILATSAKVLNRATGTRYPESGYSITYPALPLSSDEVRNLREDLLAKINVGLLSKVDAYKQLHPGLDRDQAIHELARIALDKAAVDQATQRMLAFSGVPVAAPAADLEVGKAALLPAIVQGVTAGTIPPASAIQMMIAIGVAPELANGIVSASR